MLRERGGVKLQGSTGVADRGLRHEVWRFAKVPHKSFVCYHISAWPEWSARVVPESRVNVERKEIVTRD